MHYLLQEPLYETVLDMQRLPDEEQDQCDERMRPFGKINGKLLPIIMGAVSKNKVARDVMFNYEGEKWAFDLVEYLMRRFLPKGDERLGQLLVKFGQLTMLYEEGPQEFTDRVLACKIEIKAVDSSQVPTEKQTIVRLKEGIKFAYPLNYRVLKMSAGKLSLEEILEKINSFTEVNEITDAVRGNYNRSEESHSNGKVMKEHEPAWKKKDKSKHDKPRCFICDSTQHLINDCPNVKEMNEKIKRAHKKKNFVRDEFDNSNANDGDDDAEDRSVSSAGGVE